MTRMRRQRGFTLIELMVSGALTFFLMLVGFAMLEQSADLNDSLKSRLHRSQQARQIIGVLSDGGAVASGTTGTDGTRAIYGMRSLKTIPSGIRTNYQLTWSSNGLQVTGDAAAQRTVTCKGAGNPLPDCAAAGTTKTVNGWMGADPVLNNSSRSVGSSFGGTVKKYTVETTVTVTDPDRAARTNLPADASDTYRTITTLGREW